MTIRDLKTRCKSLEGGLLVCQPEWTEDGRRVVSDAPTKVKLEGDRAVIIEDGGLNTDVLEKVKKHIEENIL